MATDPVLETARAWLDDDPDPASSAELRRILDDGDEAALAESFGDRLRFGTAGIRGPLGPGPNRMNVRVVRRLAAAVAAWCGDGPVVVGHDARYRSADFAAEAASVLAGAGLPAVVLPGPVPTPVLAFAVRHLDCRAGLMVTASHNPRDDNGIKVYDGTGAQIVEPADLAIAAAMEDVRSVRGLPLGRADRAGTEVLDAYLDAAAGRVPAGARDLSIVHTALHGVATSPLQALLARAGFAPAHVVGTQADPDPAFPTVTYPNPEEPGALGHALAEGTLVGADIVLANDPDADRLAVAVPDGGEWRILTGDEIGALLGDQALRTTSGGDRRVASSLESSTVLGKLAAEHGATWQQTLTGVKWIVRVADDDDAARFVFGYEQALGYVVNDVVRDKDGLAAAAAMAALAAECKAQGATLVDRLDTIARRHGLHATRQWSTRVEGIDGMRRAADAVRRLGAAPPATLAGLAVERVEEPAADVVVLWLAGGSRVIARPSGTEPKLKTYGLVVEPDPARWAEVDARLDELGSAVSRALSL